MLGGEKSSPFFLPESSPVCRSRDYDRLEASQILGWDRAGSG